MNRTLGRSSYLLLTGLWMLLLVGINTIPLEDHEAYVLQTTEQMRQSDDWIVPVFNGALRLEKPPLNYWATGLISALDPFHERVQIWHGRLVSLLAALLMLWATARTGALFYGPSVGMLAASLLMGMQGFIHLSHNARPDFLYSCLGLLQLLAWTEAWHAQDRSLRQWVGSLSGWLAAGLAVLSKGPQLPGMILLGFLIFLARQKQWRRVRTILQPLSGSLLLLIIVLPWWTILNHRLHAMGADVSESQLSGSLLLDVAGWWEVLKVYYLYTLFALTLPVGTLLLWLLPQLKQLNDNTDRFGELMLIGMGTILVAFTLGGQYRKHYIIALLPITALLLARLLSRCSPPTIRPRLKPLVHVPAIAAGLACFAFIAWKGCYPALLGLPIGGVLILTLLRREFGTLEHPQQAVIIPLLPWIVYTAFLTIGIDTALPLSGKRAEIQELANHINERLEPNGEFVEWQSATPTLPFLIHRDIPWFSDPKAFVQYFQAHRSDAPFFAILPHSELPRLRRSFDLELRYVEDDPEDFEQPPVIAQLFAVRPSPERATEDTTPTNRQQVPTLRVGFTSRLPNR